MTTHICDHCQKHLIPKLDDCYTMDIDITGLTAKDIHVWEKKHVDLCYDCYMKTVGNLVPNLQVNLEKSQ